MISTRATLASRRHSRSTPCPIMPVAPNRTTFIDHSSRPGYSRIVVEVATLELVPVRWLQTHAARRTDDEHTSCGTVRSHVRDRDRRDDRSDTTATHAATATCAANTAARAAATAAAGGGAGSPGSG